MDSLWSETCWSTFKYFIILILSTYYILCISWIIKCLIIIDARCKYEDSTAIQYGTQVLIYCPSIKFRNHTYCKGTLKLHCTSTFSVFPGITKLATSPGHGKNMNLLMSICCRLRHCPIPSTFKQHHYTRRAKRLSPAYPNSGLWRDSHVECTYLTSTVLNSSYTGRQTGARRKETVR